MIRVRGVDHVAIGVRDLETSLRFYTGILGFPVSKRENQKPGVECFLDCGSSLVGLIQGKEEEGAHPLKEGGIGGDHVGFRVGAADFDGAVEALKKAGVPVTFVKKRERSWSAYFEDPDGNKLEITAWPEEDRR